MGPDERAIRELQSNWIDAVNAADLARLLTLMADDAVILSSGSAPLGREEFSAAFLAGHKQGRIICRRELEEIVITGDVAYTRGRDTVSLTPFSGGEAIQFAGYALTIWRKQPDGRWVLAREANLVSPVAKPG
jgi:uncharacterized protein (TIGR02246 family)